MSNLEAIAIMLAAELEIAIQTGHKLPTAVIDTLHRFKKAQQQEDERIGADLEAMYKQATKLFNIKKLN